ncbi:MAG TPA: hypothetical protein VIF57_13195 [Polyangia bacterium]
MGGRIALVFSLAAAVLASPAARASKWTGPTMVVVEAEGFRRVDCPADRRVRAPGAEASLWLLARGPVCLAARWTRVVEARTDWPAAMTDAFMQRLGRGIYVSGGAVPAGRAEVLLIPAPTYEGKAISGVSIQSRLVSPGDSIVRLDASALARAAPTEGPYRDTFRVDLRWSRWQIGRVALGERETIGLTLIVQQACLPGPVDLARCTAYGNLTRSVPRGDGFQSLKLAGTLTLDPAASTTFLGTIDVDARADGDVANGQGHQRIHARFTPGEVEVLPEKAARKADARRACLEKCRCRNRYTDCGDAAGHMLPCPCHCD